MAFVDCAVECAENRRKKTKNKKNNGVSRLPSQLRFGSNKSIHLNNGGMFCRFGEIAVGILFVLLVVLWFARDPGFAPGYASLFKKGFVGCCSKCFKQK
jgi:hypothetical protein